MMSFIILQLLALTVNLKTAEKKNNVEYLHTGDHRNMEMSCYDLTLMNSLMFHVFWICFCSNTLTVATSLDRKCGNAFSPLCASRQFCFVSVGLQH